MLDDADAATIIHRGIENICEKISLCRDTWVGCSKLKTCNQILNTLGFAALYKAGQYIPLQVNESTDFQIDIQ